MGTVVQDATVRRFFYWLIISAAFTALVIQFSYAHGKLLCPPFYDDVAYFEDALHRLEVFHSSGVGALIADYFHSPPHSAFSTFLAVGAFAVLGVHDWAPYVANGFIILALLVFLDFLCRDLSTLRRLSIALIVLCIPISAMAVHEFRPDIASALCTAIGAALVLWKSLTGTSARYRVTAGAMFGLGALFKPPTSPLTAIVCVATLGVAILSEWLILKTNLRKILIASLQCIIPAILIPLPHFLTDWRETYNYIYQAIFGPAHSVWARPGTLAWHLRYYFDGPGGAVMLGGMAWVLVAIATGGIVAFIFCRNYDSAQRVAALLLVGIVAYAVPTATDVKEPFFGTTFTWLLAFAAVFVLAELLRCTRWAGIAIVLLLCAASLRAARLGPNLYQRGSPIVRERNELVNNIYASLLNEHFPYYARVYITSTGYVNPGIFDYYYRRDTLHALNIGSNAYSDNLPAHQREIESADYVIASESNNGVAYAEFVKSGLVQDQTLAIVRSSPNFQQVAAFLTLNGKHYYLFRRTNPFCGWVNPVGIVRADNAGPDAPRTSYWANSSITKLTIPTEGPPKLRVVLRARSTIPRLQIRVNVDGHRVGRKALTHPGKIEEFTLPFALRTGGEHVVELLYDPPLDAQHVFLFTQLEIIPDELK